MLRYMKVNDELYPMNNKVQIEEGIRCMVIHHQGELSSMSVRETENPFIRLWPDGEYTFNGDPIGYTKSDDYNDVKLSVGLNYVENNDTLMTIKVGVCGDTWILDEEPMSPIVRTADLIQTLNEQFNEDSDEDYGDPEDY